MKNNTYLSYYLALFAGIRDSLNFLIYNDDETLKIPENGEALKLVERKKFSFMLMFSENSGKDFRWLLLEDQKNIVIEKLKTDMHNKTKLESLNISAENFFNNWIDFRFGQSGMVQYFHSSVKDTEFIKNFNLEKFLIRDGYKNDFKKNNNYNDPTFKKFCKALKKDPVSFLESIWGFHDIQFYYIKLPKLGNLEFIGIFPILFKTEYESKFFDNANYIFSMVKSAVFGANLMRDKMNEHLTELRKAQLKTATIAILVDSFSHNISAHSLSAIIWLYLKRVEKLSQRFLIDDSSLSKTLDIDAINKKSNLLDIVKNDRLKKIANQAVKEFELLDINDRTYSNTYFSLQDILKYMDKELKNKFFDFEELSFDVDYSEKKKNPEIPIPIDTELVILLKYLNEKSAFWNGVTRDIPSGGAQQNLYDLFADFFSNVLFLGTIAHSEKTNKITIKIGVDYKPQDYIIIDLKKLMDGECDNINFTTLCDSFREIRVKLKNCKSVFLPGSLIGKHALFTIWENTLRNIKHCKIDNGIIFCININTLVPKLFCFDIYLENPPKTTDDINNKIKNIDDQPIITDDGKFVLGGSSQDKICAAMLITNRFGNVDEDFSFKIDDNKCIKKPWINTCIENELNLVHKKFCLWKGDESVKLSKDDFPELNSAKEFKENISRFKFSVFDSNTINGSLIAENGLIRYFDIADLKNENVQTVYQLWNNKWIKFNKKDVIHFGKGYSFYFHLQYKNQWDITYDDKRTPISNELKFSFLHGEAETTNNGFPQLQFRTHGPVIQKFFSGDSEFRKESLKDVDEFIETLLTKIIIIDNRIESRIKERGRENILQDLFLNVYSEEKSNFSNGVLSSIKTFNPNFFILHLSFIESLDYRENNISKFVKDYFRNDKGCFILNSQTKLIITTGRGRGLWWDNLKEENELKDVVQHILFKPIDSLLNAVEDGLIFKDDFMVKYNLLKEIFGS